MMKDIAEEDQVEAIVREIGVVLGGEYEFDIAQPALCGFSCREFLVFFVRVNGIDLSVSSCCLREPDGKISSAGLLNCSMLEEYGKSEYNLKITRGDGAHL